MRTLLTGCAVATVDAIGTELTHGHVLLDGDRIAAVGNGSWPGDGDPVDSTVDGTGCLLTPGLVNTHHHLYQWATRGLAQEKDLFGWLTELYPVWSRLDADLVGASAAAALGWLARTGCTTSTDHHYLFPRGGGDVLEATVDAARRVGLRFHPTRGSMDLGRSAGGLPPDEVVEDTDTALAATQQALDRWHDPAPGSMLRMAVAPCSPFSASRRLMQDAAALARTAGVRLHTHLAETAEEDAFCRATYGCTPTEYVDGLGWLGSDVWLAHCVRLGAQDVHRLAATGTAVAHCPTSNARLGAGTAPLRALLDAGVSVGLGVDGAASNEQSSLATEMHAALLAARALGGPAALTAREALHAATRAGAACLGRLDEIGSVEVGKLADLALWWVDGLAHAGIDDPVAALVLGSRPPLVLSIVGGRTVVRDDHLVTQDEGQLARAAASAARTVREQAGTAGGR